MVRATHPAGEELRKKRNLGKMGKQDQEDREEEQNHRKKAGLS